MAINEKELEERARNVLGMTQGTLPIDIIVETKEEATWLKAFLKGKKNSKVVSVRIGSTASCRPQVSWNGFVKGSGTPAADTPQEESSPAPKKKRRRRAS